MGKERQEDAWHEEKKKIVKKFTTEKKGETTGGAMMERTFKNIYKYMEEQSAE